MTTRPTFRTPSLHGAAEWQPLREALARYYDGLTTLAEEEALAAFMAETDDLPAEFAADREVLLTLADEAREARLTTMVQALSRPPHFSISPRRRWLSVAAAALLLLGVGAVAWQTFRPKPRTEDMAFTDTCASPAEAEAQLDRALTLISSKTGAGIARMEAAREHPARARHTVSKYISFE